MTYHFVQYFEPWLSYIPEKDRIAIAKAKAVEDLTKELMKHANIRVDEAGNVRGEIEFPPYNGGYQML